MTLQNSIYAPTPFAIAKGGTGNSTALTNGQFWIGNTGNIPSIGTISAGSGISVTNGPGSISIASTGPSAFVWNLIGSSLSINMTMNNGYIINGFGGSPPTFNVPSSASPGDTFIITASSVATGGFVVAANSLNMERFIYLNNSPGSQLTTTVTCASITIIYGNTDAFGYKNFLVLSTNGATFTLT